MQERNKRSFGTGVLLGAAFSAPWLAVMALAQALFGATFLPFAFFNGITRLLPGPLVTFGIDLMIDTLRLLGINVANTAKTAEQAMAIGMLFIAGSLLGGFLYLYFERAEVRAKIAQAAGIGLLVGGLSVLIARLYGQGRLNPILDSLWLLLSSMAVSTGLAWSYLKLYPGEAIAALQANGEVERIGRRQFLITVGASSAAVTVLGAGLARVLSTQPEAIQETAQGTQPTGTPLPNVDASVQPVPGTRPEYTPIEDHYKVFIQTQPTVIEEQTWELPIRGLVDNPLTLTLDDLRNNYTARDQFITLSCISGRIPTTLISTTRWTGASLQEVLADAQLQPEARYLHIESADGFFETVDLQMVESDERIMLCYAWDGEPLPTDHGFPLRIWLPDRFGMKQPKWITNIEVSDSYKEGYWVERGWDEVAQIKTRSVIDTVAVDALIEQAEETLVPIGGIAFAGARGISRVEVRVDGSEWRPAQMREPLSGTTWVIWRYEWPFEAGEHTFEVRCFEADGTAQITAENPPRPSGATGIHAVSEQLS